MAITHKKIAEIAGVSQATVSKALADSSEINPETAAYIRKIASELGYFREKCDRRRKSSSYLYPHVALLVPEIVSWFYAEMVTQIHEEIHRRGGLAQIYVVDFDEAKFNILIDQINREHLADCIISYPDYTYSRNSEIPILYMSRTSDTSNKSLRIFQDTSAGILEAVRHLKGLGHTSIGFLGERNTKIKLDSFCTAMKAGGLTVDEDFIYTSAYRFEQIGHDGVRTLHFRGTMPTALIAAYDEVAFGAISELHMLGYRVPEDVSVIGCNDIPYASYSDPPLTTITTRNEEMARIGIGLLLRKLEEPDFDAPPVNLPTSLVIRASTAKASRTP